eukprot:gene10870-10950_t
MRMVRTLVAGCGFRGALEHLFEMIEAEEHRRREQAGGQRRPPQMSETGLAAGPLRQPTRLLQGVGCVDVGPRSRYIVPMTDMIDTTPIPILPIPILIAPHPLLKAKARKVADTDADTVRALIPDATVSLDRRVRALNPWPGTSTLWGHSGRSETLKVLAVEAAAGSGVPGTVLDERLTVATGDGALRITRRF